MKYVEINKVKLFPYSVRFNKCSEGVLLLTQTNDELLIGNWDQNKTKIQVFSLGTSVAKWSVVSILNINLISLQVLNWGNFWDYETWNEFRVGA